MVKKKAVKKVRKGGRVRTASIRESVQKSKPAKLITSDIDEDVKQIKKEVKQAEKWMVERKKFFIKLIIVVGMILALLIFSNIL